MVLKIFKNSLSSLIFIIFIFSHTLASTQASTIFNISIENFGKIALSQKNDGVVYSNQATDLSRKSVGWVKKVTIAFLNSVNWNLPENHR